MNFSLNIDTNSFLMGNITANNLDNEGMCKWLSANYSRIRKYTNFSKTIVNSNKKKKLLDLSCVLLIVFMFQQKSFKL